MKCLCQQSPNIYLILVFLLSFVMDQMYGRTNWHFFSLLPVYVRLRFRRGFTVKSNLCRDFFMELTAVRNVCNITKILKLLLLMHHPPWKTIRTEILG